MGFFKRNDDEEGIESITGARIVPAPEAEEDTVELAFETLLTASNEDEDEDSEEYYDEDVELANKIAAATPAQLAGEAAVWLAVAENDRDSDAAAISTAYLAMARYIQDFGNLPQKQQEQ